ncbi:hypothetical protein CNMCM8812_006910 [Aspergillus fumigatus]|nr:hypothetical protein CNMCM8714_003255 [Aspergillus fumigatus]KAF4256989.1 hypothetical protein CNMCM8812_006910 [Aspergillus fumigatus]
MRRPIRPRHLSYLLHIGQQIRPHRNHHARVAEHARRHERNCRPVHGDQAAGQLVSGRQASLTQRILETERAAEQEAYVVGGVHLLEILSGCDVAAGLVDAVLREVGAEVEIRVGDAGCWGHGVRVALGDDAEQRAGDGVAQAEGVEVWGVAGGEDQEVGLEEARGEARGVCDEVLAGEEAGGVRIALVVAGVAGVAGVAAGHMATAAAAGHAVYLAS